MTSSRPYLIRAIHQWLGDNDLTPHLIVSTQGNDVIVPSDYVEDGKIVLNVSHAATNELQLGNERIAFSARFGGRPFALSFPPDAVLAVYAKETGVGMAFQEETPDDEPPPENRPTRPTLRIVK